MAWQKVLMLLFVAFLVGTVHTDDINDDPTPPPNPTTTTTLKPTTTTLKPTTTTLKPTTTTLKPTTTTLTTTLKPTTTTLKPTTTTLKPTSTTIKPTSTTLKPTTTTTAPKPSDLPAVGTYYVKAENGTNCIVLSAGMRLWFKYDNTSSKPKAPKTNNAVYIDVTDVPTKPKIVGGTCSNTTQSITVPVKVALDTWTITLVFNRTKHDIVLTEIQVNFTMTEGVFPNASSPNTTYKFHSVTLKNQSLMETPKGQGFRCGSHNNITFMAKSPLMTLETRKLQSEAYRTENTTELKEEYTQCEQDNKISNIVPIAVGAALGALVLIVLIAYLVGRKRNQRGYESV